MSSNPAELLDVARDLTAQDPFDVEVVLGLLSKLSSDDLDVQIRGAIRHAQLVTAAAHDRDSTRSTPARYALARVIVLLEERMAEET